MILIGAKTVLIVKSVIDKSKCKFSIKKKRKIRISNYRAK